MVYADAENKKYPIDTKEHVIAAWAFIHMPSHAAKYSVEELRRIKARIRQAARRFGIELSEEHVERDAKLFEAGRYEDKGIEISEADLQRIAESTEASLPLPIRVQHSDGPLHLGVLGKVWRSGRELFGRLVFTRPAWELVKSCGARKLSIALNRERDGIAEVSLVSQPRIADAAVFACGEISDWAERNKEDAAMAEVEFAVRRGGQVADLEKRVREMTVDDRIRQLKQAGKLTPGAEPFARAMLMADQEQVLTFSENGEDVRKPVSEVFLAFLDAQPKVVEFSELAPSPDRPASEFSREDERLFARLGITTEQVRKRLDVQG